jgi:hypothetical protein
MTQANFSDLDELETVPRPGRQSRILWPPQPQRNPDQPCCAQKHGAYSCWTCSISENRHLNSAGRWTTRCFGGRTVDCVEFCSVWVDPAGLDWEPPYDPAKIGVKSRGHHEDKR